MSPGAHWLDGEIGQIRRLTQRMSDQQGQKRRLATVEPDLESGAGWFLVTERLRPAQLDLIEGGDLRDGHAREPELYDILEVAVDGEKVQVKASLNAPRRRLELHVPSVTRRQILSGLADGLEAVRGNPLLEGMAHRSLTPFQLSDDLTQVHGWAGLRPAQQQAVGACCAPGLQLIWGPPGTGKTHVIASSIGHLAATGRRVLLVSSTNIAVDTALSEAIRVIDPPGGQVVRVGAIHLPALAADSRVNVDRLAEARLAGLQSQLNKLQAELDELSRAGERLAAAETRLAGFRRRRLRAGGPARRQPGAVRAAPYGLGHDRSGDLEGPGRRGECPQGPRCARVPGSRAAAGRGSRRAGHGARPAGGAGREVMVGAPAQPPPAAARHRGAPGQRAGHGRGRGAHGQGLAEAGEHRAHGFW